MTASALVFRLRVPIFIALYILGFTLPLGRGTLWLAAATLLARAHWVNLSLATLLVTIAALGCLALGAALRVWGTAYLGSSTMSGLSMRGDGIVAAGPYRHLRNPLYLGSWFLALGVSLLMPPGSALCFLLALSLFVLILVAGEERFLSAKLGEAYHQYVRSVPRFLPRVFPRLKSKMPSTDTHPRWIAALLAETYALGITICFAVLAWRYNAHLLLRCVIVCYGLSMVVRAIAKPAAPNAKPNWF